MTNQEEVTAYCLTFDNVYKDDPFHDPNWCVIRHKGSNKIFAWIFYKDGNIWVNVKCDPQWRDLWRQAYDAVVPAFHLNKEHWNSIILDGSVPRADIERMIAESYDLTNHVKLKKILDK